MAEFATMTPLFVNGRTRWGRGNLVIRVEKSVLGQKMAHKNNLHGGMMLRKGTMLCEGMTHVRRMLREGWCSARG
jgi:hypothetical protein